MAFNAFNQDEKTVEKSKISTMGRLFKYLLKYKGRIAIVFFAYGFWNICFSHKSVVDGNRH